MVSQGTRQAPSLPTTVSAELKRLTIPAPRPLILEICSREPGRIVPVVHEMVVAAAGTVMHSAVRIGLGHGRHKTRLWLFVQWSACTFSVLAYPLFLSSGTHSHD